MSAVKILLDDLTNAGPACTWEPDAHGDYLLTVEGDVVLSIHESPYSDEVSFYSSPGYLWAADWLKGMDTQWRVDVAEPGGEPDVRQTLTVDPQTGVVVLVRTWQRARLDSVRFRGELESSARLHRLWAGLLPETPDEQLAGEHAR